MQQAKTAGKGCQFDIHFNWVSDTCAPEDDDNSEEDNSDPSTNTPDPSDDEDNTAPNPTSPSPDSDNNDDAGEAYHLVVEGRTGQAGSPKCLAASATETVDYPKKRTSNGKSIGTSCCRVGQEMAKQAQGFRKPECRKGQNYADAQAHCASKGGRLCTQVEMQQDKTAGTGCSFDLVFNWVSDSCQPA